MILKYSIFLEHRKKLYLNQMDVKNEMSEINM